MNPPLDDAPEKKFNVPARGKLSKLDCKNLYR